SRPIIAIFTQRDTAPMTLNGRIRSKSKVQKCALSKLRHALVQLRTPSLKYGQRPRGSLMANVLLKKNIRNLSHCLFFSSQFLEFKSQTRPLSNSKPASTRFSEILAQPTVELAGQLPSA